MRTRSRCATCGKTAKENGTFLNKIKPNGVKVILCKDCLKAWKEEQK